MFTVPLIPPDLRHEETIIQAAHALCCLEKTIISVFDQVSRRIQKNDAKLQNINSRIGRAQEKVKGLVGTKKSIKIFAPSRFPATQILREDIPTTFSMMGQQSSRESVCRNDEHTYEIKTRPEQHTTQSQNEKLVFFHVRVDDRQNNELIRARALTNQQQGHGKISEDTKFLTSALRYNSDEFIFDSTSSEADSWKQAKLFKKQRQQQKLRQTRSLNIDNARLQLAPPPHSLSHRDKKAALQSLRYTPRLSDLPNTELPLDLPDLPGIADDIQYVAQEQMQERIAPSLLIEDLPDLEELENQQKSQETNSIVNQATSILETTVLPPLPPPPPPPMDMPIHRVNSNAPVSHPPPPPPPPPPLMLPTTSSAANSHSSDMRSDLMAAIRNAGGAERAKLKPAAPINAIPRIEEDGIDGNSNDNKPASSGSGLMEELHNKLMLRRKGISGSKESENKDNLQGGGSNPLLSHLSSLIPQTSKPSMQMEQDIDDDDWAD